MEKIRVAILCVLFFCLGLSLAAQDAGPETILTSSIDKVTVYADRAVVERKASFDIKPGTSFFVFDDLPERVSPDSIQLKGSGPAVQEDLIFRTKYFASIPDERIRAIQVTRDEAEALTLSLSDRISRLAQEKSFMEKIAAKVTSADDKETAELNPEKWQQMVKFYRDRLGAIDQEKRTAEREQKAAYAELGKIDQELRQLSAGRQKKKNQALAVLSSEKGGKVVLTLSYTVQGPSWRPSYDIRVDSEKKQVQISYNANILQNTGENWDNVALALSTARAELGGSQPDLSPWYLSFSSGTRRRSALGSTLKMSEAPAPRQMFNAYDVDREEALAELAPPMETPGASAQTGATSVVFSVAAKAKIDSDGLQHRVFITGLSMPAYFRYSTAPKLSMYAYLKAKVKNESEFPILEGGSKVFLDGNFVSDSSVEATAPGQEFWVFLGVDEGIKVEYKLVNKVLDSAGVFEKKNRYIYLFETQITNAKKSDIEIVLWDQLPISSDKSVVVKLIEPKYSKDSETLKKTNQEIFEWLLKLKSGEKTKVPLSFSVEYPADGYLQGLDI